MSYVLSLERIATAKSLQQGWQQGEAKVVLHLFNRHLGQIAESVAQKIREFSTE